MKYMVMECHFSYAVVLDEEGRFLKVANLHYEVGQRLTEVVVLTLPALEIASKKKKRPYWYSLGAMAACLLLLFTFIFPREKTPYASVYFTVNPQVRIDVNQKDVVINMEGLNVDGEVLLQEYSYEKEQLDKVVDELAERSIQQQYLTTGGKITLTLESEDQQWIEEKQASLKTQLESHIPKQMEVTVEVKIKGGESESKKEEPERLIIPEATEVTTPIAIPEATHNSKNNQRQNYDDSLYDEGNSSSPGQTPTQAPLPTGNTQDAGGQQAPAPAAPPDAGAFPYKEAAPAPAVPSDAGASPYEEPAPLPADDGNSPYQDDASDDGQSSYDD